MSWKELALAHAKADAPNEACGLLVCIKGRERYIACKNVSTVPKDQFIIEPSDWAKAEELGDVLAVVHSHPILSPEPSGADKTACEATNLPWYICNPQTEAWVRLDPSGWKAPLIGRQYVYGVHDCWSLVRDYYLEKGIFLRDWERPVNPEDFRLNPKFEKCYIETGFRDLLPDENLEDGDSILFAINSSGLNHMGVFLGDGQMILHHIEGRLSSRDFYGEWLVKCTGRRLRYAA